MSARYYRRADSRDHARALLGRFERLHRRVLGAMRLWLRWPCAHRPSESWRAAAANLIRRFFGDRVGYAAHIAKISGVPSMNRRCVATGHDDQGRSVFKSDSELEPVALGFAPGLEFHRVWGADETPSVPNFVPISPTAMFFPPPGGVRVIITTFPVEAGAPPSALDMNAVVAEAERKVPGMLAHMEPENPGMHTTNSVDVDIVLSGEVVLELDDDAETVLRTGDVVLQNGTRHRWHNRGSVPAVVAAFLVGADRTARQ